jgi:outer membrane receptor protein involved in Fe transport
MKTKLRFFAVLLAVTLAIAWSIPSVGQVLKGSISGTVVDPQGAVVSGAAVKVTNIETGVVNTTTSDSSGMFRLNLIPTGTYTIEVGATGFKTASQKGVAVTAGSDSGVGQIHMTIGETSTTVEVTAAAPLIETTQAQVTNTFSGAALETFAGVQENEGMDRLALFVPGVVASRMNNFSNTNGAGTGFSSNGLRGRNNDQQIDGQNNNDNSVGGPGLFVTDANFVQQYVIVTNNFGPEYGRNSGSVVNIITKSGANAWHGNVLGDENSSYLNALNNTQRNTNIPGSVCPPSQPLCNPFHGPPRSNQEFSGGTIGGPIVKNKAFLFSGFDEQIISSSTVYTSGNLTPTPAGLATLAGCFPSGPGAAALAALSKFGPWGVTAGSPTVRNATTPTTGANVISTCPGVQYGGVTRVLATPGHQFNWIEKADLNLGGDSITGRYLFNRNNNFNTQDNGAAGYVLNVTALSQSGLISWTHNVTARMVNEARIAFGRLNVQFGGNSIGNTEPTAGNLLSALANVATGAGNLGYGPANNLPQARLVNTWQGQDNWNYVLGRHSLKSGVNFTYQRSPNTFLPSINGTYSYSNWSNYFNGIPNSVSAAFGNPVSDFREYDTFVYGGDDWKVTQNLTLSLGLTWSYYGQPANLFHNNDVARESGSAPFWNPALPISIRSFPSLDAPKNSFGPSVGFAYSPQWGGFLTGHGKTVLRGGYRLVYDPAFYNIYLNIMSAAPQVLTQTLTGAQATANPIIATPTGPNVRAALASSLTLGVFDPRTFNQSNVTPNFAPDRVHTWTFGIEREITRNAAIEARYAGNRGTNLFQSVDGNPFVGTASLPGLAQDFPNLVPAGVTGCTTSQQVLGPGQTTPTDLGRANCGLGVVRTRNNGAYSDYHALQVEFRANNLFKQLTVRSGYTWSKDTDNVSEIFGTNTAGNTVAFAQNQFNTTTAEHSLSGLNIPQAWTIDFVEQLPFFKEQHGFLGHVLGGWSFAGNYVLASGQPYTASQAADARISDGAFSNGDCPPKPVNPAKPCINLSAFGNFYDSTFVAAFAGSVDTARPFLGNASAPANTVGINAGDYCLAFLGLIPAANQPKSPSLCNTTLMNPNTLLSLNGLNATGAITNVTNNDVRFILNGRFSQQVFGTPFGNVPRNSLVDAISNVASASIYKTLKLGEHASFEMHMTAINALNHFNFTSIDPFIDDAGLNKFGPTGFANPALSTANGRQVFVGGKITF